MSTLKSRWWWFIGYPDSLPDDYLDILSVTGIPFIVSPLHDSDITNDGEIKKPHYHFIVIFDNPTTYNHVLTHCCKPLNSTIPKVILSLAGAVDYLTHKNDPDKFQYDFSAVNFCNGSDLYFKYNYNSDSLYSVIEDYILKESPSNLLSLVKHFSNSPDCIALIRQRSFYFSSLMRK